MSSEKKQSDFQLAETLYEYGQLDSAKKILIQIEKKISGNFAVLRLLGFIAGREKNFHIAAQYLDRAVRLKPDFIEGWYYLGKSLHEIDKFDEAVKCFSTAIHLYPDFFEALHDRGMTLCSLYRLDEAIESFQAAYAINPDSPELWKNLIWIFSQQKKPERALSCCEKILKLRPDDTSALRIKGDILFEAQKFPQAIAEYERVLSIDPDFDDTRGFLVSAKLMLADWSDLEQQLGLLKIALQKDNICVTPFILASFSESQEEQFRFAKKYAADLYPESKTHLWQGGVRQHDRIRIAYLSADFHSHATAFLMLDLFKKHDRKRFDVTAISFGPDDGSEIRKELAASFDQFIDVRGKNDRQIAELLHEMEIDIAIDLKGYTKDARPGIFAYRPAPIQVSYLGYPGTMGVHYMDYLIADRFVIPETDEKFYSESIVSLPDSYQTNGKNRSVHHPLPLRAECGLPEQGFIFCSFNNTYKNNPTIFNVWMNVLKQVEGSILWLLATTQRFEENIRAEALKRGIDPKRIFFAKNEPPDKHLARIALADLFLDSLPYTAHTTASDALWMNVPVVTCVGSTFPGRVGQSILNAIEMPELVTYSLNEYQQLAIKLATDTAALSVVREKLRQKIQAAPLFDADRFTYHLECAYEEMWKNFKSGKSPKKILVPAKKKSG